MPLHLAMSSALSRMQFHACAQGLLAEVERLQRFETAYKEFIDKTDWVRPNSAAHELGMHVADVIRKRCDDLTSHNQAQAEEIVRLRERMENPDPILVQCLDDAIAEQEKLEKDAARYRYMRKCSCEFRSILPNHEVVSEADFDAECDSSMSQEQQP